MIQNEDQLAVVRRQLGLAEKALDSIRREVRPKSEQWYRIMAESYIDMILQLRAEIDQYTGVSEMALAPVAAEEETTVLPG